MNDIFNLHQDEVNRMASTTVCARDQETKKSFLPLKRKLLDQCMGDRVVEYPHSKRFISEEAMASHLEQLQLTSVTRDHTINQPSVGTEKDFPRQQLNIKTVASCPHSVGRKRYLKCRRGDDGCDNSYNNIDDSILSSTHPYKRIRLSPDSSMERNEIRTKRMPKSKHHRHRDDIGGGVVTSGANVGGGSDLSSIPEEREVTQPWGALPSGEDRSGDMCDEKWGSSSDGNRGSPCCANMDDTTEQHSHHFNSSLYYPSLPIHSSPPTLSSPLPPSFTSNLDTKPYSLWVAPELLSATTQRNPILPNSVLEEYKSNGMELVPWVDPDVCLYGQTEDEIEREVMLEK